MQRCPGLPIQSNGTRLLVMLGCLLVSIPATRAETPSTEALAPPSLSVARVQGDTVVVEVDAGGHARQNCPVELPLPESWPRDRALGLTRLEDGEAVSVQRSLGDDRTAVWLISKPLKPHEKRRYQLTMKQAAPADGPRPVGRVEPGMIRLQFGTGSLHARPVADYHMEVVEPPAGIDPIFRRSGHIHPLRSPSGRVVTGDFAADHPHQHGVFFAWVNTTFAGRKTDFWNQRGKSGNVEHGLIRQVVTGPVFAGFETTLRHVALDADGNATPVLEEVWQWRLYAVDDPYLLELESIQTLVAEESLLINEHHYGGFAIRGSSQWLESGGENESSTADSGFLTSEGKTRADGNHTRPAWVTMFGPVDSAPCGVTVVSHPHNYRFPQPVRLHPSKPYFVFTPPVAGQFAIDPGSRYRSRYRLCVYDGKPRSEVTDVIASDFIEPPTARLIDVPVE